MAGYRLALQETGLENKRSIYILRGVFCRQWIPNGPRDYFHFPLDLQQCCQVITSLRLER